MTIFWKKCTHENLSATVHAGYCPDCGKYVENHWYVARCKCCGIRHKTVIKNGEPVSVDKFCKNCGCEDYIIEEIAAPDVVTINYAALKRVTQKIDAQSLVQTWIEKNTIRNYGFLPAYG